MQSMVSEFLSLTFCKSIFKTYGRKIKVYFLKIYSTLNYVYVLLCVYMHVSVGACRGEKKALHFLEQEQKAADKLQI